MSQSYRSIRCEHSDGVTTLTFLRPAILNAMDRPMVAELLDALHRIDSDDTVRAAIVTGAGRGFCSGVELAADEGPIVRPDADDSEFADLGGQISLAVLKCRKPLIAAVNGPAVGLGATITLGMDYRLAAEQARFGFVFTRRGLAPEGCSSYLLPRVVGIPTALDWMITGRMVEAPEALRAGLVHAVHPPDELLPAAHAIAREIVQTTSALSVAVVRRMLWEMADSGSAERAFRLESRIGAALVVAPDALEGAQSFFEKRPPRFTTSAGAVDELPWQLGRTTI